MTGSKAERVAIGLLGVNIGMSDAAILRSYKDLWILATWFYYAVRRENHLIGRLLNRRISRDGLRDPSSSFGISDYTIFVTVTKTDVPIRELSHPKQELQTIYGCAFYRYFTVAFLPAIAIGFIVITDIWWLLREAPMRWPHDPVWDHIRGDDEALGWLAFMEGFALIFGICTAFLCAKIFSFEKATGEIMLKFYNEYIWPKEPPAKAN